MIDGKSLAKELKDQLRTRIQILTDAGSTPSGTILVGDDGPSRRYVGMKHKDCAEVGLHSGRRRLPNDATQVQVEEAIAELNDDPAVAPVVVRSSVSRGSRLRGGATEGRPAKDAGRRRRLGLLVIGEHRQQRAHHTGFSTCSTPMESR